MRIVAGIAIAFLLGALCRWLRVPLPAPSSLLGALLIACVTLGYLVTGYFIDEPARSAPLSRQAEAGRAHEDR